MRRPMVLQPATAGRHSRRRPLPDLHTPTFMEGGGVAFKRKDACKNMTTAGTGHCRRRQAKVALNATHSKTFFTGCTLIRCATQRGPLGEALVVASHRPCSSLAASAFCVKPEAHGQRLSDTFEWATHPQVGPVCIKTPEECRRCCLQPGIVAASSQHPAGMLPCGRFKATQTLYSAGV